jgi:hypothetical protein
MQYFGIALFFQITLLQVEISLLNLETRKDSNIVSQADGGRVRRMHSGDGPDLVFATFYRLTPSSRNFLDGARGRR